MKNKLMILGVIVVLIGATVLAALYTIEKNKMPQVAKKEMQVEVEDPFVEAEKLEVRLAKIEARLKKLEPVKTLDMNEIGKIGEGWGLENEKNSTINN